MIKRKNGRSLYRPFYLWSGGTAIVWFAARHVREEMQSKEHIYRKWIWLLGCVTALFILPCGILLSGGNAAEAASIAEAAETAESKEVLAVIRIEGQFEQPDRQALLDRLNEIRREACEEGVNNPVNGEPLTEADYVPVEWSDELEQAAALRAVETSVLRDHIRPDGSECFTVLPDSSVFSMETLAWGYGSTKEALEGWYSEKESYTGETGEPAGHYIALITPDNQYVGIADLRTSGGRDSCAGAFGITRSGNGESTGTAVSPASSAGATAGTSVGATAANDYWEIPLTKTLWRAMIQKEAATTARRIANAVRRGFICMR